MSKLTRAELVAKMHECIFTEHDLNDARRWKLHQMHHRIRKIISALQDADRLETENVMLKEACNTRRDVSNEDMKFRQQLIDENKQLKTEVERLSCDLQKVINVAHKFGWNGVENSKILSVFIENGLSGELSHDEEVQEVECPDCWKDWGHGYCGTCGGRGVVRRGKQP